MHIKKTKFLNVKILSSSKKRDHRGYFHRIYCSDFLKKKKIPFKLCQSNISYNKKKGTLRGLHYQTGKKKETKIITCIKGSAQFYVLDVNKNSKNYMNYLKVKLSEKNENIIYVPKGFATGFQTLEKDTTIIYFIDNSYSKEHSRVITFMDKRLNIKLPLKISNISKKDKR